MNLNTLEGVDPSTIDVLYWDGRHNNWEAGPRATPWPIHQGSFARSQTAESIAPTTTS